MSSYQITLNDRSMERIEGADAYQQEGPMTTFFQTGSGRNVVDTWSTRVASFRTSEVITIRRLDPAPAIDLETVGCVRADRDRTAAGRPSPDGRHRGAKLTP